MLRKRAPTMGTLSRAHRLRKKANPRGVRSDQHRRAPIAETRKGIVRRLEPHEPTHLRSGTTQTGSRNRDSGTSEKASSSEKTGKLSGMRTGRR